MSRRSNLDQTGYTLVELMVVIVLVAIIGLTFYSFVNTSLSEYGYLQTNATYFSDLAGQSQRLGNVLRGLTDIVSANANDITVYAYFSPNDTYVSLIHYYLNSDSTILYADVTPMTSNPPIGTPISSQLKTFTVIPNFYKASGINLFDYLDSSGNTLTLPLADEHTVKSIRINLAVPTSGTSTGTNQSVNMTVSLRNRKTNL